MTDPMTHSAENDAPRTHRRCGSIQCATCFPDLADRYNEAVRARLIPPEGGKS